MPAKQNIYGWCVETEKWVKLRVDDDGSVHFVGYVDLLSDIGDVTVVGIATGMGIYWDAATSLWKVKQFLPLAGGTLTGPLIIDDDTHIQLGDTAGQMRIIPWAVAADLAGILLQPGAGNRYGFLGIQPKGTEDRSQLSLYNRGVGTGTDYSVFTIEVNGDTVGIIFEDGGTPPTSIAKVQLGNDWETRALKPVIDKMYGLGTSSKRYVEVNAERHKITQALTTDHTWSGLTAVMTAEEALTIGQAVFVGDDGKMELADKDLATTMPAIALVTSATIAEDAEGEFLMQGFFRENAWDWTPGGILYVGDDGALTQDVSGYTAGDQVQVVGVAITADIIYFNPSYELVEIS